MTPRKKSPNGTHPRADYHARYWAKNKAKVKAQRRIYYLANKEKFAAYNRHYHAKHPNYRREYHRIRYPILHGGSSPLPRRDLLLFALCRVHQGAGWPIRHDTPGPQMGAA